MNEDELVDKLLPIPSPKELEEVENELKTFEGSSLDIDRLRATMGLYSKLQLDGTFWFYFTNDESFIERLPEEEKKKAKAVRKYFEEKEKVNFLLQQYLDLSVQVTSLVEITGDFTKKGHRHNAINKKIRGLEEEIENFTGIIGEVHKQISANFDYSQELDGKLKQYIASQISIQKEVTELKEKITEKRKTKKNAVDNLRERLNGYKERIEKLERKGEGYDARIKENEASIEEKTESLEKIITSVKTAQKKFATETRREYQTIKTELKELTERLGEPGITEDQARTLFYEEIQDIQNKYDDQIRANTEGITEIRNELESLFLQYEELKNKSQERDNEIDKRFEKLGVKIEEKSLQYLTKLEELNTSYKKGVNEIQEKINGNEEQIFELLNKYTALEFRTIRLEEGLETKADKEHEHPEYAPKEHSHPLEKHSHEELEHEHPEYAKEKHEHDYVSRDQLSKLEQELLDKMQKALSLSKQELREELIHQHPYLTEEKVNEILDEKFKGYKVEIGNGDDDEKPVRVLREGLEGITIINKPSNTVNPTIEFKGKGYNHGESAPGTTDDKIYLLLKESIEKGFKIVKEYLEKQSTKPEDNSQSQQYQEDLENLRKEVIGDMGKLEKQIENLAGSIREYMNRPQESARENIREPEYQQPEEPKDEPSKIIMPGETTPEQQTKETPKIIRPGQEYQPPQEPTNQTEAPSTEKPKLILPGDEEYEEEIQRLVGPQNPIAQNPNVPILGQENPNIPTIGEGTEERDAARAEAIRNLDENIEPYRQPARPSGENEPQGDYIPPGTLNGGDQVPPMHGVGNPRERIADSETFPQIPRQIPEPATTALTGDPVERYTKTKEAFENYENCMMLNGALAYITAALNVLKVEGEPNQVDMKLLKQGQYRTARTVISEEETPEILSKIGLTSPRNKLDKRVLSKILDDYADNGSVTNNVMEDMNKTYGAGLGRAA